MGEDTKLNLSTICWKTVLSVLTEETDPTYNSRKRKIGSMAVKLEAVSIALESCLTGKFRPHL